MSYERTEQTSNKSPATLSSVSRVLQRKCACGQHSQRGECEECAKKKHKLQRKLMVGASNDPLEQEADRVAEHVISMPMHSSAVSMPRIQRFSISSGEASGVAPESVDRALVSQGQPLNESLQQEMSQCFGYDFSGVRVHTGSIADQSARELGSQAYTVKQDIVFAAGRFAPQTYSGRRLLAHEMTHVVQQSGGRSADFSPVGGERLQRKGESGKSESKSTKKLPNSSKDVSPVDFTPERSPGHDKVKRIYISCAQQRLRLETSAINYTYVLTECSLPMGSYETQVTVSNNDFHLDFGKRAEEGEAFEFTYKVEADQENPATYLSEQPSVHVDVVSEVPAAPQESIEKKADKEGELSKKPQCSIRLDDRDLVKSDSLKKDLFKPKKFKKEIWNHKIPLGQFGWVAVVAKATGGLSGNLAASYGPGRLSNLCLTHLVDSGSDGTTIGVGGRAHFSMPARAAIRLTGNGKLKITGDYLSVIEVAAATGELNALGEAILSGQIDADVDILAKATRAGNAVADSESSGSASSDTTASDSTTSGSVAIDKSTITDLDIAASVGLRGRASLLFKVDLSAGFSIAGVNLWSQTWPLVRYNPSVSWNGGLRYSPNPGIHWDLGAFGVGDSLDGRSADDEVLDDSSYHSDTAEVDEDDVVQAILDETRVQVNAPDGSSPDKALPFDWYKPIDLYPLNMALPNADDPQQLGRDDGQTEIRFPVSLIPSRDRKKYSPDPDGFVYERIGVDDWPAVSHEFQYTPYDSRSDPEKERFKRLVDALGYSRAGLDIDHVWELNLRGQEYDRFDNLWPASNQEQQLAGSRHRIQISNYESRLGNVNGRWFVITRVRHPA
ncbi:DUF4157 domain-containing protein [Neptunomonas qingdaonensis]|uniref:eCIS core domain-containing protein n=1 Tax=Neptunomonas qingdaonensis TaxID=1045558 RepID=A0A1I2PFM3_9GAMM|nr:DUF4157 domain-containing protein [Neptunomonas qingdaonensis]SFG14263.1 protein of unknown function [Neptunomonas qingdaonensis]